MIMNEPQPRSPPGSCSANAALPGPRALAACVSAPRYGHTRGLGSEETAEVALLGKLAVPHTLQGSLCYGKNKRLFALGPNGRSELGRRAAVQPLLRTGLGWTGAFSSLLPSSVFCSFISTCTLLSGEDPRCARGQPGPWGHCTGALRMDFSTACSASCLGFRKGAVMIPKCPRAALC